MTEKWSFAAVMDAASKGTGYGGAERRGNDCIAIPNRSGLCVCSTAVPTFPRAVCWHSLWSSSSPQIQNESSEERGSVLIIVGTSFDHHSPTCVTHSNVDQPFESFWASSTLNFFDATNTPVISYLTSEWKNLFAWDELVCLYEQPSHRLTVSVFFSMDSLPQLVSSLKARNSCPDYEMVIIIVYNNHK